MAGVRTSSFRSECQVVAARARTHLGRCPWWRVLQLGHEAQDVDDLCVQVSVIDDAIIATLPGTSYSVTYHKRNEPWLLTSDIRDVTKEHFASRCTSPIGSLSETRSLGIDMGCGS